MFLYVFDFDGPIFDGRKYAEEALLDTLAHFEKKYSKPQLSFRGVQLYDPTRLINLIYAEAELSRTVLSEIEDYYRKKLLEKENVGTVIPEVKSILLKMKEIGIRMALFTGRRISSVENLLKINSIYDCFEIVVGRDSVTEGKPSPQGIIHISKETKIPVSNIILIGDSDVDYESAHSCNATYYHAAWTNEPSTCMKTAKAIIQQPRDLNEVLLSGMDKIQTVAPSLPQKLIKAIQNKELSFYAGAGISVSSGIGGWSDHYLPVFDKLKGSHLAGDCDLAFEDALQLLASKDAKDVFDNFKESFEKPNIKPNSYHYSILRSSVERIWTTNYDQLFELANSEGQFGRVIVKNDNSLLNNFTKRRLVVKMNGDFEGAVWNENLDWDLIFLREQFDTVEEKRSEIWRTFEDDYRNNCIVFVGISFNDSALRRIVSIQRRKIPRTRHNHFFLTIAPRDPISIRKSLLHARNLERISIKTLFFKNFSEIELFVSRVTLSSIKPVVTFCGSIDKRLASNDFLPNGEIVISEIKQICHIIGKELALSSSYMITSGGAPGIGIPAVSGAFEANPLLAQFYLRKRPSVEFSRVAPAIIIEDTDYSKTRKRLIGEAHIIIALGGRSSKNSGVIQEVEMALSESKPVLLIPQAGGAIFEYSKTFKQKIAENIQNINLRNELYKANDEIANVESKNMEDFVRSKLPKIIEKLLLLYVSSNSAFISKS
jgi:phosphoglycolate phosphatase/pyrophosphatase PpaX